jgi:hypothetical protein
VLISGGPIPPRSAGYRRRAGGRFSRESIESPIFLSDVRGRGGKILCCSVKQVENGARTLLGHMGPFQSISQKLNSNVSNDRDLK